MLWQQLSSLPSDSAYNTISTT